MDAPTDLVAALDLEGRALLEAAEQVGPEAEVATCADWRVADVLGHVGRVYRSVLAHVVARATEMIPADRVPAPPVDGLVAWVADAHGELVEALAGADPSDRVWSWSPDHSIAFYHRRMALETAVHRVDVQSASAAGPMPVDGDLGAVGVTEFYGLVAPFALARWSRPVPGGRLGLRRTDGHGAWTVQPAGDAIAVTTHAAGDEPGSTEVVVSGPGGDLLLFAWNRPPVTSVTIDGDPDLARAWARLAP